MTSDAKSTPQVAHTIQGLRDAIQSARQRGKSIGLVPTMGALHEGHLSLVRASRAECDFTAVTIFVNPTQFGPNEDLDKYPRTLDADVQLLAECGTDLVFAPAADAIYPDGFSTYVQPPTAADPLEGRCRPGHFRGVTTIVLKLFNQAQADVAFFGQKDYQQALVIRRMVEDLDVPTEVQVCPIIREADGLAMSSRNRYLNQTERQRSLGLWRALQVAEESTSQAGTAVAPVLESMRQTLADSGVDRIEYVAICDPETLQPLEVVKGPAVALIAAFVGETRLIDNHWVGPKGES